MVIFVIPDLVTAEQKDIIAVHIFYFVGEDRRIIE